MPGKLYLGCPIWACEQWKGLLFTANAPRGQWLTQYASAFNTVEGNSTFYALPSLETAQKWATSVAQSEFKFALKVPRSITHDCRLLGAEQELAAFIAVARVLHDADCLGPSFIQLPPDYSPRNLDSLTAFLESLPTDLPWALELRHVGWFDSGQNEDAIDTLLRDLRIDKVIFDSRPLYSKPPSDEIERVSQTRKPKTPIRQTVTASHPFLRFIGRNTIGDIEPWINEWAPVIAHWLRDGLSPFVFTHAPDDRYAPPFARRLYEAIQSHYPELPAASGLARRR